MSDDVISLFVDLIWFDLYNVIQCYKVLYSVVKSKVLSLSWYCFRLEFVLLYMHILWCEYNSAYSRICLFVCLLVCKFVLQYYMLLMHTVLKMMLEYIIFVMCLKCVCIFFLTRTNHIKNSLFFLHILKSWKAFLFN